MALSKDIILRLLRLYIEDLSEKHYSCQWEAGIEYDIWLSLCFDWVSAYYYSEEEKRTLRGLAAEAQCWMTLEGEIEIEPWLDMFREWLLGIPDLAKYAELVAVPHWFAEGKK